MSSFAYIRRVFPHGAQGPTLKIGKTDSLEGRERNLSFFDTDSELIFQQEVESSEAALNLESEWRAKLEDAGFARQQKDYFRIPEDRLADAVELLTGGRLVLPTAPAREGGQELVRGPNGRTLPKPIRPDHVIRLLLDPLPPNPHRNRDSVVARAYDLYRDGLTVAEFHAAGGRSADLQEHARYWNPPIITLEEP